MNAQCCTTVREIIDRAYGLLGDPERVHWPVAQLVAFLNEALCEILTYRPDAFTRTVTLTLRPGRVQSLPSDYRRLVALIANAGGDQRPIREVSEDFLHWYESPRACRSRRAADVSVGHWVRNSEDPSMFIVDPPIPEGVTHQVTATVVVPPPRHTPDKLDECTGVDCAFDAQLLDWIMARALEVDMESARSTGLAQTYRANFYTALGVDYVQESRFNSGNWLGRQEGGEPQDQTASSPRR